MAFLVMLSHSTSDSQSLSIFDIQLWFMLCLYVRLTLSDLSSLFSVTFCRFDCLLCHVFCQLEMVDDSDINERHLVNKNKIAWS